jgi:predicted transcriptional regulator
MNEVERHSQDDRRDGRLEALEALARLGAGAWLRTARWYAGTGLRLGSQALGVVDRDGRIAEAVSDLLGDPEWLGRARPAPPATLRERGERLLAESADVNYEQGSHPAYARMLSELAPDEARILRLIAQKGPQPAVDVRAGFAFVPGSRLIAQGFSMIGAEAGCRFTDQVPAYLSNLNRLGLIWFSREAVRDRGRYQVLEVQPEVMEALKEAGRFSHVVRRSIRMTPLGDDFCAVALPLDTAEFVALGEAMVPDRSAKAPE